jgi:hypothetical protein
MTDNDARDQDGSSPLHHLRHAYRARKALEDFRDRVDIIDVNRESPLPDAGRAPAFIGDFVVGILDVRLLVVVVSEVTSSGALCADAIRRLALEGLARSPDVDALAVVANDELMTTLVFEAFDRPETVRVPGGQPAYERPAVGPAPLIDAIGMYLNLFDVNWRAVGDLPAVELLDTRFQATRFAVTALESAKRQIYHVDAKIEARNSLTSEDAKWATEVALRLYEAGAVDNFEGELDQRADSGMP